MDKHEAEAVLKETLVKYKATSDELKRLVLGVRLVKDDLHLKPFSSKSLIQQVTELLERELTPEEKEMLTYFESQALIRAMLEEIGGEGLRKDMNGG